MTEHELVPADEPVVVGVHVVHLVRFHYMGMVAVSCGLNLPEKEVDLDERAAWAHLPVCERCLRSRQAQVEREAEKERQARAEQAVPDWL